MQPIEGEEGIFLGFFFLLNVFPNMFPLAPQFYPICFAQSSPPFSPRWVGQGGGMLELRVDITYFNI
jgi:hypothetical protein